MAVLQRLTFVSGFLLLPSVAQPGGSNIDKSTHSCSKNAAQNAFSWLMKYLPVEEADDDCSNRECTCGEQSRVALKTSSLDYNVSRLGVSAGFGIHCTYAGGEDDTRAAANGGVTQLQVETRFQEAIGDWSTYDSDVNVRAWSSYRTGLWAESGLDWYVAMFKNGGVKTHMASWQADDSSDTTYWSIFVLVPPSPVVLELMGSCTTCGSAAEKQMPKGYVGRSGPLPKAPLKMGADAEQGMMTSVHVSRWAKDLSAIKTYYKNVMGVDPSYSATFDNGDAVMTFNPAGTSAAKIQYFMVAGNQSGSLTTEGFQTLLLDTAKQYQTSPSACWPIWGDFHYSYQGQSMSMLSAVTAAGNLGYPYRSFAGSSVGPSDAYVVEPSGYWIQLNGDSDGLPQSGGFSPDYCYTFCSSTAASQEPSAQFVV